MTELVDTLRASGMLPHQAHFVEQVLTEANARTHVLVAPVGLGAARALIELAVRTAENRAAGGVLFVVPALALLQQTEHLLKQRTSTVEVLVVRGLMRGPDLAQYAESAGAEWARGKIVVISAGTLRRPDLRPVIEASVWSLVVVDGAPGSANLQRLLKSSDVARAIVRTSTPHVETGRQGPVSVSRWEIDVVDWDGKPLFAPTDRRRVRYSRSPGERAFASELTEFARSIAKTSSLVAASLLSAAASSPTAIEVQLVSLLEREQDVDRNLEGGQPSLFDEEDVQQSLFGGEGARRAILPSEPMQRLVGLLDEIGNDAKVDGFVDVIRDLFGEGRTHILVFTTYVATLRYVQTLLEDRELRGYAIHGSTTDDERMMALEEFRTEGGVLVCTDGMLPTVVRAADVGIHYDAPRSLEVGARRAATVHFLGQARPPVVITLHDDSGVYPVEETATKANVDGV